MPRVQTRFVVTFGFLVLGCSMLYSRTLAPDIDFTAPGVHAHRAIAGNRLPVRAVEHSHLPDHAAAAAGRRDRAVHDVPQRRRARWASPSSTAMITSRTQTHMAYLVLSPDATPIRIFAAPLTQLSTAIQDLGSTAAAAAQKALGQAYQTLIAQAGFLAYKDVFLYCALLAFAFRPFTFFFSPRQEGGRPRSGSLMRAVRATRALPSPCCAPCWSRHARSDPIFSRRTSLCRTITPVRPAGPARPAGRRAARARARRRGSRGAGTRLVLVARVSRRRARQAGRCRPRRAISISRRRTCGSSRRAFRCSRRARKACRA